jgi:hypothetical protein
VQRLRLRRFKRFQQPIPNAVFQSAPFDFVRKKSSEPHDGADRVTQRREPKPPDNFPIA